MPNDCQKCGEPHGPMLDAIDDGNWREVFKYAQPSAAGAGTVPGLPAVSDAPFTREDVRRVLAMVEGENDGPDWVGLFQLKDGRYASITAGCDYTGWG